nr:hypothetical protein [Brachyspira hyodysenteriae]
MIMIYIDSENTKDAERVYNQRIEKLNKFNKENKTNYDISKN